MKVQIYDDLLGSFDPPFYVQTSEEELKFNSISSFIEWLLMNPFVSCVVYANKEQPEVILSRTVIKKEGW